METMSYTFVPSFISMRGTVSKFEEKIFEHVYQVSSPCVLPLVSLRSEEVIFLKNCLRIFVVVQTKWLSLK